MIHLTSETRIMIAAKPIDFRKSIDALCSLCNYELKQNARNGTLFVFISRDATKIRILTYEKNGFWLMTKRLSSGRFNLPKLGDGISNIQASELRKILSGLCQ